MKELRDWCIAFLEFMEQLNPSSLYAQAAQAIERAFERGDLRGLKLVARDVREWASALSMTDQQRLDDVLRSRFGRGLTEKIQEVQREVEGILRRGRIDTDDEYELLTRRADEIYADDSKGAELKKVNKLLAAYKPS